MQIEKEQIKEGWDLVRMVNNGGLGCFLAKLQSDFQLISDYRQLLYDNVSGSFAAAIRLRLENLFPELKPNPLANKIKPDDMK